MRSPVGFAEVPDFHVEVARQMDPTLVGRSVVVGGDPTKRGKVVAASADQRLLLGGGVLGPAVSGTGGAAAAPPIAGTCDP